MPTKTKHTPPDPTARWKKLSPTDRYLAVASLISDTKGKESNRIVLSASVNIARSNSLIAQNKAILAVLRALIEPELWDLAVKNSGDFDPLDPNARQKLRKKLGRPVVPKTKPARRR